VTGGIKATLLLLLGLGAGYFLAYERIESQNHRMSAGSTVVDRSPDSVLLLSYSTSAMIVTAQRSRAGAPFAIQATFADGRPMQRCTGSPDLSKQLAIFSSLVAKREISYDQREAQFPIQLGVLDVRDAMMSDPDEPMLVFTNPTRSAVAFIFQGYVVELTIPVSAFTSLQQGCATLASR
jgi:hypothetical protein